MLKFKLMLNSIRKDDMVISNVISTSIESYLWNGRKANGWGKYYQLLLEMTSSSVKLGAVHGEFDV